MQGTQPFRSQTVASLTSLDVDAKFLKFGVCNFESDKYIAVRDENQGQGQLTILDLETNNLTRKPNKSEKVLMHPRDNIIALMAKAPTGTGNVVQIFNMAERAKLKDLSFTENIVYWHWVSLQKLAIVTTTSVYHVNLANNNPTEQVKILDRSGALAEQQVQIIGYALEASEKWCALFGISTPDNGVTINGHIQLYLIEGAKQQLLDGHCCTFGEALVHSDTYVSSLFCFFEKKGDLPPKVHISEIGTPLAGATKHKKNADFPLDPQFPKDFPVVMQVCKKYGLLFLVTKMGFFYAYEITQTQLLYKTRISDSPVFVGARDSKEDGIYVIAKNGNVILTRAEKSALLPYLLQNCQYIPDLSQLCVKLASRYNLEGVNSMFTEQFNRALISGDYKQAAGIAAQAPGDLLRNQQTIQRFKGLQPQPGQPQPILQYFQTLLEKGRLNKLETLELCAPVLQQQNRIQLVQGWVRDNKLEVSEELGDLVQTLDPNLAIDIYKQSNAHPKVVNKLLELGRVDEANIYAKSNQIAVDYITIVRNTLQSGNAEGALNMAKNFFKQNPATNVHSIAELFATANRFQELTAFLVDCMKGNRPEDGPWQTRVLEFNLQFAPQVAETILQMDQWNQYNRPKIAQLCEQKGLFQRALENYNELKDIKRCILNTHAINLEWLTAFLIKQQPEWSLQCCQELLRHNRQNTQVVVNVFLQNHVALGLEQCIKVFEAIGVYDGIYLFLGSLVNSIDDKNIIFKYIEASCKCGQLRVVEAIIKDRPDSYDAVRVKDFLKELKLADPKPLIFLCDIHNFVDELTKYLYKNNFNKYIEIYLFKVNPNMTPQVLGALIDLECDENYIKQILYNIRGGCPIEPLIEEFEKRNKIRVLEGWLDSRVAEGNQIPAVHNALAKIKIDTNQDPENFLMNNQFYDPKIIGRFCEDRDPHFAVIAYKRSWGTCDQELITVTNKNALFRLQARYLVERQSKELWSSVLSPDNPYRKQIIEQVVSAALPESKNVDEVSTTVQAFMEANLPLELISLLEKIVLHNSEFGKYKKLQNLLIITAIKADKTRVMDYINRLDNYDSPEIAKIALGEQYQLYEEAFVIYKKNNYNVEAINVLLDNIEDVARAADFAEKVNQPEVWSRLGQSYLSQYHVTEAINSFLRAKDHTAYNIIIGAAENDGKFEDLIRFLLMSRELVKDSVLDNSLAYCYAKLEHTAELEVFISGANSVDAQKVGDRCFDQKLYQAAKILYTSIKNNSKIASCLVRLKEFSQAIESAKKANTPKTWKELCMACVEAQEFKLAAVAGMNIIIHPDHLEDLIKHYEEFGVAKEMIDLLETGMGLERAHIGIYTELGVLYAKYQPQRLMEHIKQYFSKLNVSKLLRICERFQLWREAVYLHQNYDEFDNALSIMVEHSPTAFQHEAFVSIIQKCANTDLYYRAIIFYIEEQPEKLNDLLKSLTTKLDVSKVVSVIRKTGYLALILPFMKSVQNVNNKELNEALNELYLEQEDYESLKQSISQYQAFDQAQLARLCEHHQLSQFRRIAAFLYRKAKQYEFSIKISKQDQEYRDAIETAQESQKPELVEELLRFFVAEGEKEYFTVCLYTAYDLVKPDVAMELSWRFGLLEFAMPFFIQITRELTSRVETVQKKHDERVKKEEKQAQEQQNKPLEFGAHHDNIGSLGLGFGAPMLPPPSMLTTAPPQYGGGPSVYPGGGSVYATNSAPFYTNSVPYGAAPGAPYGSQIYRSGVQ